MGHQGIVIGRAARLGLSLAALGLTLLYPSSARATELPGASIEVFRTVAAAGCPSGPELARATLALGALPVARGPRLELHVRFERDADAYVAHVQASGRKQGERELRVPGDDCRALAAATRVVLALLLDIVPADAPPSATKPAGVRARAAKPPAAPAPAPRSFALGTGVETGMAYGLLGPSVTGTAAVAARLRFTRLELELAPFLSTPHFESIEPGFVTVSLLGATARGCLWSSAPERPALGGCIGLGLGALRGGGHGYETQQSVARLWAAPVAALVARIPLAGAWSCRFSVQAAVPLRRQAFVIEPLATGFRSAPLAVSAAFGPELHFW